MGQPEASGETEEGKTATGAVNSQRPDRRSIGPPHLHLRRHHGWKIEVAYCESKQLLGFHDPQVWCAASVSRAHPMAWFVGALVVLWYAQTGQQEEAARRQRPWYKGKVEPTYADMLATCRLHLWRSWLQTPGEPEEVEERLPWLLHYLATAA